MKLTILVILSLIGLKVYAEDEFSSTNFRVFRLTQSIYMLEGAGGNITASIGADGVLLVDSDFAEMSGKLLATLKELRGDSPRMIINTHFHYDHTGGNKALGKTATIIAATSVRKRLSIEQILWKKKHAAFPPNALPVITYDDSLQIHFNNDDVKALHFTKGHTDGDTVVFFSRGKVVSLGDLYFANMYPIFHPEHDGNLQHFLTNLNRIIKLISEDAKIVPGHGPFTDKKSLVRYRDMISSSINFVKAEKKSGSTLTQIQKKGLPKKWEPFGKGYRNTSQWIEAIFKEI